DLRDKLSSLTLSAFPENAANSSPSNPLSKGLEAGLRALPAELLVSLELTTASLLSSFPTSYSIYKPMLLLPSHALSSASWSKLLSCEGLYSRHLTAIWKSLAEAVGATHIAINAGIPTEARDISTITPDSNGGRNILRSPINLTPVYGDFGPRPTPTLLDTPTRTDFDAAFWVSTCQNGIHQVWAPLYTMFSRGNIREKTRLLTLPSVVGVNGDGVDLYAGIGYFAFSYKKAGFKKILCWELNPWSVEGLRRGAERNGWTTRIFKSAGVMARSGLERELEEWCGEVAKDVDFLVFQQSNESAVDLISRLAGSANLGNGKDGRGKIGRVRHVNCGLLPSSSQSWKTAVRVVDPMVGGWIHVHENVGVNDIETKEREVVSELQKYLDAWCVERGMSSATRRTVRCEHVERVKTYAPGVLHVVFDIWVD
ncbi:S-adenosyl-L-methionine-dependent methyltransferase, partial [Clohesyomyces aquaticus]